MSEPAAARPGRWRAWAWALVGLALVVAPLVARVIVDGRAELRRADEAAAAGDVDGELRHLGRAGRWSLPLARHDDRACSRIEVLAQSATEAAGPAHSPEALAAWRELRRVTLGTRSVLGHDRDRLARANRGIVEQMAREAEEAGREFDPARARAELSETIGPPPWRGYAAAACLAGWLLALVGFALRGIDEKGRIVARPASRWGGAVLALLVGWLLLM